jgi:fibronectin-binding autotransporter adhesin
VSYNGNGNTAGSVPVDATSYSSGASATVLSSNTLVKTGNSFVNWNTAANGSGTSYNTGSSLTVNSNTTLYAQWSLNQYTATYLAGVGGTISGTATQTVSYGTSTTPVTAVPSAGYRFTGWSDSVATATRSDVNFTSNRTVTATFDNNLTWDNGAGTTNWNTTDANWTGAVWNNSVVDSASFNNVSNTVSLTQAITGGSLAANFGGTPSGTHNFVLTGNTLSLTNIVVWGGYNPAAGGGGVNTISEANNQRLTISNTTVSVTGNVSVRRGSLMVQGNSVLNAAGLNTAGDNWAVFLMQDSASVTVTNGFDFSATACAAYLNGGTLTTPFISVEDAAFNGTGGLFLDGGITLVPTGDTNDFIQVFNSGNNLSVHPATIGSGGLVIDSAYAVTIANPLNGTGGLTKKGAGTLTLTAPYAGPTYGNLYPGNTYAGKTVVQGGVLSIATTYALPGGAVSITNGAVMDLNYGGSVQVAGLTLNGVTQPNGTYGATGSGATFINDTYFTGTGVLNVYSLAGQTMTWTGATDNNWDEATANWTNGLGFNQWLNNSAAPNSALFDATGLSQPDVNVALASTFYASNVTFNAAGYTITNTLTLGNTPNFVVNSNATISGLLNGSGGLTKTGNGTLTLTRYSELVATYSGATTVNAGTLELSAGVAWILHGGSAVTVNSGATLQGNDSLANQLNGLTLNNGTVSATGSGNIDWGNFYLTSDVSASGTSYLNADIALRAATVTFGVAGGGILNVGGVLHNGFNFGANLNGGNGGGTASTVVKSGSGTLVLSGANAYTGNTVVQGGVLSIGSTNSLSGGAVVITNGAVMNLNYSGQIQVTNVTLNGVLQSGGTFGAVGSGANHPSASFTGTGLLYVYSAAPPTLSVAQSGNNLTFTWTGSGSLEWQTNSLSTGLGTNWVAYPNGTNGVIVLIDASKGSVFFRVKQ